MKHRTHPHFLARSITVSSILLYCGSAFAIDLQSLPNVNMPVHSTDELQVSADNPPTGNTLDGHIIELEKANSFGKADNLRKIFEIKPFNTEVEKTPHFYHFSSPAPKIDYTASDVSASWQRNSITNSTPNPFALIKDLNTKEAVEDLRRSLTLLQLKNRGSVTFQAAKQNKLADFFKAPSLRSRLSERKISSIFLNNQPLNFDLQGRGFAGDRRLIPTISYKYKEFQKQLIDQQGQALIDLANIPRSWQELTFGDPVGGINAGDLLNTPKISANGSSDSRLFTGTGLYNPSNSQQSKCNSIANLADCFLPSVALHNGRTSSCSGILLSPRYVLTAAHCMCTAGKISYVTLGQTVEANRFSDSQQTRVQSLDNIKVDDGLYFPDTSSQFCEAYRSAPDDHETFRHLDLAIFRLHQPIISHDISLMPYLYAAVGHPSHLAAAKLADIVGFGRRHDDSIGGEKHIATINLAKDFCFKNKEICDQKREFVAMETRKLSDSCGGDSGGGVFATLQDGRKILLGIVSRGVAPGCGPGGVYVSVVTQEVRDWIRSIVPNANLLNENSNLSDHNTLANLDIN